MCLFINIDSYEVQVQDRNFSYYLICNMKLCLCFSNMTLLVDGSLEGNGGQVSTKPFISAVTLCYLVYKYDACLD